MVSFRVLLFPAFVLFTTFSQSQKGYDIGVKTSSFERDRIQLDQRIALNDLYSVIINISGGWQSDLSSSSYQTGDSTLTVTDYSTYYRYGSLNIGASRRLGIAGHKLFYVAATIGAGIESKAYSRITTDLKYPEEPSNMGQAYGSIEYDVLATSEYQYFESDWFFRGDIIAGLDIPLAKRLLFNCAANAIFFHSQSEYGGFLGIKFQPSVSAGIRVNNLFSERLISPEPSHLQDNQHLRRYP